MSVEWNSAQMIPDRGPMSQRRREVRWMKASSAVMLAVALAGCGGTIPITPSVTPDATAQGVAELETCKLFAKHSVPFKTDHTMRTAIANAHTPDDMKLSESFYLLCYLGTVTPEPLAVFQTAGVQPPGQEPAPTRTPGAAPTSISEATAVTPPNTAETNAQFCANVANGTEPNIPSEQELVTWLKDQPLTPEDQVAVAATILCKRGNTNPTQQEIESLVSSLRTVSVATSAPAPQQLSPTPTLTPERHPNVRTLDIGKTNITYGEPFPPDHSAQTVCNGARLYYRFIINRDPSGLRYNVERIITDKQGNEISKSTQTVGQGEGAVISIPCEGSRSIPVYQNNGDGVIVPVKPVE